MVEFALALALLLQPPARAGRPPAARRVAAEAAVYRSAEAFDVAATAFDAVQTWRGLGWHNPREQEAGDARWFVNPHSQAQVSAFLAVQEALVVYLAQRLQRRRGWVKWAAPALLGFEAFCHFRGGVSWYAWRPFNRP